MPVAYSLMKYHRPAFQGSSILLSATIVSEEVDEWKAIHVRAEASDSEGSLLAEGNFKVIPVSPDKFKAMVGIDALPKNWAKWLGENGT
jgi:acyl-CoA thioesterase FadM